MGNSNKSNTPEEKPTLDIKPDFGKDIGSKVKSIFKKKGIVIATVVVVIILAAITSGMGINRHSYDYVNGATSTLRSDVKSMTSAFDSSYDYSAEGAKNKVNGIAAGFSATTDMSAAASGGVGGFTDLMSGSSLEEEYRESGSSTPQSTGSAKEGLEEAKQDAGGSDRMLRRTVYIKYELPDDTTLNSTIESITEKAKSLGAWVEQANANMNAKSAYGEILLRIPKEQVDTFLSMVSNIDAKVLSKEDNQEDVTLEYSDMQTRLDVLKASRSNYMKYLESADSISDMIELQDKIDSLTADIESYQSRLNILSQQVEYSIVAIDITCKEAVAVVVPDDDDEPFKGIGKAFKSIFVDAVWDLLDGLNIVVVFIVRLVYLIPMAIVLVLLCKLLWKLATATSSKKKSTQLESHYDDLNNDTDYTEPKE